MTIAWDWDIEDGEGDVEDVNVLQTIGGIRVIRYLKGREIIGELNGCQIVCMFIS